MARLTPAIPPAAGVSTFWVSEPYPWPSARGACPTNTKPATKTTTVNLLFIATASLC